MRNLTMLPVPPTALRSSGSYRSRRSLLKPRADASASAGNIPYCATYLYASSSTGFGCAIQTGYTKSVLTTTKGGVDHNPFGASSTSSDTSMNMPMTTIVASPESSLPAHAQSSSPLSSGATAGIVAGGAAALVIVAALLWFCIRKRVDRKDRAQSTIPYRVTDYNPHHYVAGQETLKSHHSWPLTPTMYPTSQSQSTGDRSSIDPPDSIATVPGARLTAPEGYSGPQIPELMTVQPTPEQIHNNGLPLSLRAGSHSIP